MKKKFIVRPHLLLLAFLWGLIACDNKDGKKITIAHADHTPGTETLIDSSLAFLLKPVNQQVVSTISTIKAESGTKISSVVVQGSITYDTRSQESISSRVSGRIERLFIKYNYQPVRKGELIMEIYSPDLAAAQRELLFIYQTDANDGMLQKAKQRLLLLGMKDGQINELLQSGKIFYRIPVYSNTTGYILEKSASREIGDINNNGGTSFNTSVKRTAAVLLREGQYINAGESVFTIYDNQSIVAEFAFDPSVASQIKKGQKITFHNTTNPETTYTGTIGLIQPTFREGSNFTLARIYLKDTRFQIGGLVTANFPIINKGWWVPQNSVLDLGNKTVVFKKERDVFVPKDVKAKIISNGLVLIADDISSWEIASNAAFLVDSDSFIKVTLNQQIKK